mmetsp:Transcript_112784/g.318859  ORF Transcript_112784/g.318859 Transcript_112784/m.318859 type:complete len:943 (-) Transcript_112784:455-3283(-)
MPRELTRVVLDGEERLRRHHAARDHARRSGFVATRSSSAAASSRPAATNSGARAAASQSGAERSSHQRRRRSEKPRFKASLGGGGGATGGGGGETGAGGSLGGADCGGSRGDGGACGGPGASSEAQARRQEPHDLEARWQGYLRSEEYRTFNTVVDCLRTLPEVSQLAERRTDFELLLQLLHRLGQSLEVDHVSKNYRAHYSPDVQLCGYLYSTLLTAFTLLPSYVLNGQEFYVSDTVLDQCQSLQYVFQETCKELRRQFENLQPYSLEHIRHDVRRSLGYFDKSWCRFEMPALEEIEAVHRQACRPLIEAIEVEQTLTEWEKRASSVVRGCPPGAHRLRAEVQRTRLMEKICELNRLANIDGKGLSEMDNACVLEAERIVAKPMCAQAGGGCAGAHQSNGVSPVLLRVARSLLKSLERLRRILQRYARCLYQLNSHLANNPDLVKGLERFEAAWETASRYLVQPGPRRLALLAYDIVSGMNEPGFEAALVNLDPGFLVASLPRTFLLHEMERFQAARAAALASGHAEGGGGGGGATRGTFVKHVMGEARLAGHHQAPPPPLAAGGAAAPGHAASVVPRPLELRRPPTSAFQFSPIARAFLPTEVVTDYEAAAAALGRLSEERLTRVRRLLVTTSTSPAGSTGSTPLLAQAQQLQKQPTPGGVAAERPPQTPCPPRMAVPNSSHGLPDAVAGTAGAGLPSSSAVSSAPRGGGGGGGGTTAAMGPSRTGSGPGPNVTIMGGAEVVELIEEDSDDEDEKSFSIDLRSVDLTGLQGAAEAAPLPRGASPAVAVDRGVAHGDCGSGGAGPEKAGSERLGTGRLGTGRLGTGRVSTGRLGTGRVASGGLIADVVAFGEAADSQDVDARQVTAVLSTLALHLQRTRPHEWNELIQVVLQGLMMARSTARADVRGSNAAPAACPAPSQPAGQRQPPQHHQQRQMAAEVW